LRKKLIDWIIVWSTWTKFRSIWGTWNGRSFNHGNQHFQFCKVEILYCKNFETFNLEKLELLALESWNFTHWKLKLEQFLESWNFTPWKIGTVNPGNQNFQIEKITIFNYSKLKLSTLESGKF
jgi:hypothetical protein